MPDGKSELVHAIQIYGKCSKLSYIKVSDKNSFIFFFFFAIYFFVAIHAK